MIERAIPILPGDDLAVAREFYVGKLGFTVQFEATEDGRVEINRPPMNEPWGGRTFGIQDPFGNSLFVIGPVVQEPADPAT